MNELINYNKLWSIIHQKKRTGNVDWDKRAHSFFKSVSGSSEAESLVQSFNILSSDTVLDMGAGTGRFAIPIAKSAAFLTALEPSAGMSSYLEQDMKNAGLNNYTLIQKRWEDVEVGKDIDVHDIVFASNSLGFPNLAEGLQKLNAAAKKRVIILWFAGKGRHLMDPELLRRLGKDEDGSYMPDYLVILHVLHDIGIYANVTIEPVRGEHIFEDLDEAVNWWTERDEFTPGQILIMRDYFKDHLKPIERNRLAMTRNGWRAMIWWEKVNEIA